MVTLGKWRSSMGWVVIDVAMGCSCHSLYDLLIKAAAPRKPKQTIPNQAIFEELHEASAVGNEMCRSSQCLYYDFKDALQSASNGD